jgi:hypothetical protein
VLPGSSSAGDADAGENPHLEGSERGPVSQQKADPLLDMEDLETRPLAPVHGISLADESRRLANLR